MDATSQNKQGIEFKLFKDFKEKNEHMEN